jgi:hypothetical protein
MLYTVRSAPKGYLPNCPGRAVTRVIFAGEFSCEECCHPDRDEQSGQFDAKLGNVAGRWLRREPPSVFFAQPAKSRGG